MSPSVLFTAQQHLTEAYARAGGFGIGPVSPKATAAVRRDAAAWLRQARPLIESILTSDTPNTLAQLPHLLDSYDILYRICYNSPCFTYLRDITLRATERWVRGDKSISANRVALMLLKEIDRDITGIPSRYIDFTFDMLDTWIRDLRLYGRLRNATSEETRLILSALLRQDLTAYDIPQSDKLKWLETNMSQTAV